jgi:hypothetical protein
MEKESDLTLQRTAKRVENPAAQKKASLEAMNLQARVDRSGEFVAPGPV